MESLKKLAGFLEKKELIQALGFLSECSSKKLDFSVSENNVAFNEIVLLALRDCNDSNYKETFAFFNGLARSYGLNINLSIEILALNLRKNIDLEYQVRFYKSLPSFVTDVPSIRMLGAETYRRLERFDEALKLYATLPAQEGWWPFDDFWRQLSSGLSVYLLRVSAVFLDRQRPYRWSLSQFGPNQYAISDLAVGLVDPWHHDSGEFAADIERVMSGVFIPGVDVGGEMITFYTNHITDLDSDRASLVFHMISCFDKIEHAHKILQNKQFVIEKLAINPIFIHSFDILQQNFPEFKKYFEDALNIFLNSECVKKFIEGDLDAFAFSQLVETRPTAIEVLSRYRHRCGGIAIKGISFLKEQAESPLFSETEGAKHLFVGIFGKIRLLEDNLSSVFDYIERDTRAWREAGNFVSVGVSTWDQAGGKTVELSHPVVGFVHALPEPVGRIFDDLDIHTLSEWQSRLPHTVQVIQNLFKGNQQVTDAYVKEIAQQKGLVGNVFTDISTEEIFANELGNEFLEYFGESSKGALLNQARMWNRIAGVRNTVAQATQAVGVPVGKMILMRPDMDFHGGSISELCVNVSQQREGRLVVCDTDYGAHWLTGVGDRYFVGNGRAVSRLFDAPDLLRQIMRDPMLKTLYRSRPLYHRFARTVMYESPYDLKWSKDIKVSFMRMQASWKEIRNAFLKDCFSLNDEHIVNVIKRNIEDIN